MKYLVVILIAICAIPTWAETPEEYYEILREQPKVAKAIQEVDRLRADGVVFKGEWTSRKDLVIRQEELRQKLADLANLDRDQLMSVMGYILEEVTEEDKKVSWMLEESEELSLQESDRILAQLKMNFHILSYLRSVSKASVQAEIERQLMSHNITVTQAIIHMPMYSENWLQLYDIYQFDFNSNDKNAADGTNANVRLKSVHSIFFASARDSLLRFIRGTQIPLKVKNGFQEAVVHAVIIHGQDMKINWLKHVQNKYQRDYLLFLFGIAYKDTSLYKLVNYFRMDLEAFPEKLIEIVDEDSMESAKDRMLSIIESVGNKTCDSYFSE